MLTAITTSLLIGAQQPSASAPEDAVLPEFGTSGFSASTIYVEPENAQPVQITLPEDTPVVEQPTAEVSDQSVYVETLVQTQREQETASRSEERTEPVAPPAPEPAAPQPVAPAASGVVGIAQSLTNYPYIWGGSSPADGGFDCSGFTSYVFAQAGYNIPRTVAAQRAFVTPVSNPQPGDLVFWGTGHVAIYAGNNMIVDAGNPTDGISYRQMWGSPDYFGRP